VHYDTLIVGGSVHPLQGTTKDDSRDSGRNQSQAPFRQYIGCNPSMADPTILGKTLNSAVEKSYTTCLVSGGKGVSKCKYKKCCVAWTFSAIYDATGATAHVTKDGFWCE